MHVSALDSPLGRIRITANDKAITGVRFDDKAKKQNDDEHPLLTRCQRQIDEYFRGERRRFDLPLMPAGTDFQQKIWKAMAGIPYGSTVSYSELARRAGSPKAIRAAANACAANPVMIIIPCHRIIGTNGRLGGYAGGTKRKAKLLALEKITG